MKISFPTRRLVAAEPAEVATSWWRLILSLLLHYLGPAGLTKLIYYVTCLTSMLHLLGAKPTWLTWAAPKCHVAALLHSWHAVRSGLLTAEPA